MKTTKLMILLGVMIFATGTLSAQDFKYIGAPKCKMCHNKPEKGAQYDTWAKGPHANAMKSLSAEEAQKPECLKCHSTAAAVDSKLVATIKVEEGVSCETCHGPGSRYKSMGIMKKREMALKNGLIIPDEALCKSCHNEESPTFKGFNYEEYLARIAHDDPTTE